MFSLIQFVNVLFQVYILMLIVRIVASWFPQLHEYRIMQFIAYYTDPYLNFFRRFIPPIGMFDLSPIIAFLVLNMLHGLIVNLLFKLLW